MASALASGFEAAHGTIHSWKALASGAPPRSSVCSSVSSSSTAVPPLSFASARQPRRSTQPMSSTCTATNRPSCSMARIMCETPRRRAARAPPPCARAAPYHRQNAGTACDASCSRVASCSHTSKSACSPWSHTVSRARCSEGSARQRCAMPGVRLLTTELPAGPSSCSAALWNSARERVARVHAAVASTIAGVQAEG